MDKTNGGDLWRRLMVETYGGDVIYNVFTEFAIK